MMVASHYSPVRVNRRRTSNSGLSIHNAALVVAAVGNPGLVEASRVTATSTPYCIRDRESRRFRGASFALNGLPGAIRR
ncbi:hypothetical protein BDV06DRAFT_189096 [Aspergillus oleicola]